MTAPRLPIFLVSLLSTLLAMGQNKNNVAYILTAPPSSVQNVCSHYGLSKRSTIWSNSAVGVYAVTGPASVAMSTSDPQVRGWEADRNMGQPELSGTTAFNLTQSTSALLDGLKNRTVLTYFGSSVPSNYVQQPATALLRLADAHTATGLTGSGLTVA